MMTHVPGFSSGKLSRAAARAGRAAFVAVNDGVLQQVEGVKVPELPLIGSQNILTGSALAQDAVASDSGFSAACAAILGEGGTVKIGADRSCLLSGDGKFSISLGSVKQLGLGSVLGGQEGLGLDLLDLDNVTGTAGGLLEGLPVASDL